MRYAIPAALLAVLVALFAIGLTRDPSKIPSPLIGQPAPAFTLPTLDGTTLSASELRGPLLVNFWASWCTPCLQEHPLLMDLSRQGVTIIGIDYKDAPDAASQWLARHGNPFRRIARDEAGRAGLDWGVYGVPETFLIDASGVIRHKHIGPLTRAVWDAELAPLLKVQP
ncbi:MAG TPA: DsbE family thiol:disulfide interchange protein [Verrucomicrobiae bacterium]|nr:DsbE family thiol:disulfide interchange protein [Verrucomicrobiae bacterium]